VRPTIVGILNVTPDSFYDGGKHNTVEKAIQHGTRLIEQGADVIDIGGESTRPGADFVSEQEECARVVEVVQELSKYVQVSIDTTKPYVAQQSLLAGACILNDVQGLQNPAMMEIASDFDEVVIMHSRGTPKTMSAKTKYKDIGQEIYDFFAHQITKCSCSKIWLDPGIGFAKTAEQSIFLLNHTSMFQDLHCPIYIGASRKSFIPKTLSIKKNVDRLGGSLAAVAVTYAQGAQAFRVHDVAETKQFLDMMIAIQSIP